MKYLPPEGMEVALLRNANKYIAQRKSTCNKYLLLKEKPYLICIAEQCFHNAFRRKVFHAPKGYFMLPLGSISRRPRAGISFLLQEDLRHLISRLRRQLLLEEKPYMVRIA